MLPENLFYNTSAPGIILLLNRDKAPERKGQIILINASVYFVKRKPKNELTSEGIVAIAEVYHKWEIRKKLSRVITIEDARNADYSLSPPQFVEVNDAAEYRSLSEIVADLAMIRTERERADAELDKMLVKLGINEECMK